MSVGNDYLKLIAELRSIEQFDIWDPKEHFSLAYLLERSCAGSEYPANYTRWLSLAQNGDFNEFAWSVSQAIVGFCGEDDRISEKEIADLKILLALRQTEYEAKRLSRVGLVEEKCVPEWFLELFESYMKLEQEEREKSIIEYLENECSMSEKRARDTYSKLYRYRDILNEFYFYVRKRRFASFAPITVEGVSARQLNELTYLSPVGAYNYLIYLRESPKEALADLKRGLPRK